MKEIENNNNAVPENGKKRNKKVIIIIAAVLIFAVAAAVLTVLFIKPGIAKKKEEVPPVTASANTDTSGFAEYKGCKMPAEFVEILNKRDSDRQAAVKKYGMAAKVGKTEIPLPEYELEYYLMALDKMQEAFTVEYQNGQNITGFDPAVAPSKQTYPKDKLTWDKKFRAKLIDGLKTRTGLFDEAVKSGFVPDENTITALKQKYNSYLEKARKNGSEDEYYSSNYFNGITFAMYFAREIELKYADTYKTALTSSISKSYSKADVDAIFNASPEKYKTVKGNIYPISKKENIEKAKSVKTFDEFCEFVKNDSGNTSNDPAQATYVSNVLYSDIADSLGETVSQWMFSDERKAGEIGVVKGVLYNLLVYIEELPQDTDTCDLIVCGSKASNSAAVEELTKKVKAVYDELTEKGFTEESFKKYLAENGINEPVKTYYVNMFEPVFDEWAFSPERRYGDYTLIEGTQGAYIVFYVKHNDGDKYSEKYIRAIKAKDEAEQKVEKIAEAFDFREDNGNISKCIGIAEKKYLEFYNKIEK